MGKGIISSKRIKRLEKKIDNIYQMMESQSPLLAKAKVDSSLMENDKDIEDSIRDYLNLYLSAGSSSNVILEFEHDRFILRSHEDMDSYNNGNKTYKEPNYCNIYISKDSINIGSTFWRENINMKCSLYDEYLDKITEQYRVQQKNNFKENIKKVISLSNLDREKSLRDLDID